MTVSGLPAAQFAGMPHSWPHPTLTWRAWTVLLVATCSYARACMMSDGLKTHHQHVRLSGLRCHHRIVASYSVFSTLLLILVLRCSRNSRL